LDLQVRIGESSGLIQGSYVLEHFLEEEALLLRAFQGNPQQNLNHSRLPLLLTALACDSSLALRPVPEEYRRQSDSLLEQGRKEQIQ